MPQLNVAPAPIVAPPAQATPASANTEPSNATDDAAQPFAAVLKHQVDQQSANKPADKAKASEKTDSASDGASSSASDNAAVAALATDTPAQPATDALTAIAQMLPGIVPPNAQGTAANDAKGKKSATDDKSEAQPIVVALPGLPAQPIVPPAAPSAEEKTASDARLPIATAGTGTGTGTDAAEKLAAEPQGAASNAAAAQEQPSDFASLLATSHTAAGQTTHTAATATNATHIQTPVGARGWDNEFGQKLTWMVNKQESRADLVLNPPQLGRIEVSISINGDQANATFVSANPLVRDAIENAVPRLREVLQDAGISLGQTQVGAESFQQSSGNRENGDNSRRGNAPDTTTTEAVHGGILAGGSAQALRSGNGMVDTFA